MKTRDEYLLALRPEIASINTAKNMLPKERFQNETLRPIIKLQNDLLLEVFKNYVRKHKNVFHTYSLEKRLKYIEISIQRDIKFRNSLKGIIIGQFTLLEYTDYIQNSSALNKRMMNLVIQRLQSQIQLLSVEIVH